MDLAGLIQSSSVYLYKNLWTAVDWLFPPNCAGCGKEGFRLCSDCESQISYIGSNICDTCGEVISSGIICQRCLDDEPSFLKLRSVTAFRGPIRKAIHQLKYFQDIPLGETLSQYLIKKFQELNWRVDLIVCVPLSHQRQSERGYNQSSMLALPLALELGLPFQPKAIFRIRNTRTQVGLNFNERQENVKNAFMADARYVEGKKILLIDDVATTGATQNACSKALKTAGAFSVLGLTLARPVFSAGDTDNIDDGVKVEQ